MAKFVRYYDRKEVFSKKKHLKGKGIATTEKMISFKIKKLEEAREKYGFKHVWRIDGILSLIVLSIMGKEFFLSFVLFVLLFVLRIIFFWGNFATCFFQSNHK